MLRLSANRARASAWSPRLCASRPPDAIPLQWEDLSSWQTPNDTFMVVFHFNKPVIAPQDWRLEINLPGEARPLANRCRSERPGVAAPVLPEPRPAADRWRVV